MTNLNKRTLTLDIKKRLFRDIIEERVLDCLAERWANYGYRHLLIMSEPSSFRGDTLVATMGDIINGWD